MVQDLSIIYGSSGFAQVNREVSALTQGAKQSSSAFDGLGKSLTNIGLVVSGGLILQNLTNEMLKVGDATASLEAITGATGATLDFLGKQASDTGRDIQGGTAAILAGYEAIASARPELLKDAEALASVTQSAKTLAQAAGGDLETNARALTTTLAQFQLASSDANRVVNALAAGSLEGAAGIAELTAGIQASGVALNGLGTSAEDGIALLEVLADRGIKGAEAGTQIRNIWQKFAKGNLLPPEAVELLNQAGVNMEVLQSKSSTTAEKLRELAKVTKDNGVAAKIFEDANMGAAVILGQSIERFEQLKKGVTGTDVAFRQAAIRTSTTSAQLLRLKNAAVDLGVKLLSVLKPAISVAASFAESLVAVGGAISENKVLATVLVGALVAYNAATIASTASTVAAAIATKSMAAFTALQAAYTTAATVAQALYITVTNALTGTITVATAAQRLLNLALASNPIGLVVVAATALVAAYFALSGETKKLTAAEQICADASAEVAKNFGKESAESNILFIKLKNLNPASSEAKKIRDEINTTYATYLPNQLTEASNLEDIAKAQDLVTAALLRKIQAQVTEAKITEVVAKNTENLLTTTEEIGKATNLSTERITGAVSEFAKLIGGRSFEEAGKIFEQFGYDAASLSGTMVRLGGVSATAAQTLEQINRAGLGDSFLDMALSAGQADAKIAALTNLFKDATVPAVDGVADGANEAGKAIGEIAKVAESGSIDALNAQLERLQEQFNATGSAAKRADLARQIALLQDEITVASGGRAFNPIEIPFVLGGNLETDAGIVAAKNKLYVGLAEAIGASSDLGGVMERSQRDSNMFAEELAASFGIAEVAALSLRETLISKLGEEAFGKLTEGLQNIKSQFIDFAATVAQSIGQAIGSGGSLADAFRNALRDLAIQVPKLAGMALLNAAATPGIGAAALPLAVAGLALLGLSGIIAGVTAPKTGDLSPSNPSLGSAAPAPQQGLGQFGDRQAVNFSGSTFVLQVDGGEFAGQIMRVQMRDRKKRAG